MPRIDVKLASEKLGSPRVGGSVQADLTSPSGGYLSGQAASVNGRFSSASVNTSAADVKYTPIKPNDIVLDNSLDAAARTMGVFVEHAFRLQQRKDQLTADTVVLAYEDEIRRTQVGYKDENGSWVKGYLYREGNEAVGGFDPHRDTLESSFNKLLLDQPENVRLLALIRMTESKNAALGRAAKHNVSQLEVLEEQTRYAANQSLLLDIEAHGADPWTSGKVASHLNRNYDNKEEWDKAALSLATYTVRETYSTIEGETGDPEQAYAATRTVYESVRPYLSELGEQELDYWLLRQKEQAEKSVKARAEKNRKTVQARMSVDLPLALAQSSEDGNYEVWEKQLDLYGSTFKAEEIDDQLEKQSEAVIGSFQRIIGNAKHQSPQDRLDAARASYERLAESDAYKNLDPYVRTRVEDWLNGPVFKEITDHQRGIDSRDTMRLAGQLVKAEREGKILPYMEQPKGMLPEAAEAWDKVQKAHATRFGERLADTEAAAKQATAPYYRGKLVDNGGLSQDDKDTMWNLVGQGKLRYDDYVSIVSENETLKVAPKRYRESPNYQAVKSNISVAVTSGFFDKDEEPKDPKEKMSWQLNRDTIKYEALDALDKAAMAAAASGQPFKAKEWWDSYLIEVLNKGNKISPSWWSRVLDKMGLF